MKNSILVLILMVAYGIGPSKGETSHPICTHKYTYE